MDVREKLVELLNEVQETGVNEIPAGFGYTSEYVSNKTVASHLIANGVTVQECKLGAKKTNADRIRAMSDDELNELFYEIYNAGVEDAVSYEWGQRKNSFEWTMEWLQQPAEEGE